MISQGRTRQRGVLVLVLVFVAGCSAAQVEPEPLAVTKPPPPLPSDPRVSELGVLLAELTDRIEVLSARIASLEAGSEPAGSRPAGTRPAESQPDARSKTRPAARNAQTYARVSDRYRSALALYGRGAIDKSRLEFQGVFDADPSSELADNALYWIGETYFVTAKYGQAIGHYQRVVDEYGDQNKAPDALLKVGMSHAKLGDLILAKKVFQQVIEKYPFSISASTARTELKRIQY